MVVADRVLTVTGGDTTIFPPVTIKTRRKIVVARGATTVARGVLSVFPGNKGSFRGEKVTLKSEKAVGFMGYAVRSRLK